MTATKKTVIVTGASGDIGTAIVQRLLQDGYDVAACCNSNSGKLEKFFLNQPSLSIHKLNLLSDESIKTCALEIVKIKEYIAGLVNCAGRATGGIFGMTKISDIRELFEVNLFGTLLFIQLIAKKLVRQKAGSIVNIASTAGVFADHGTLAYGTSKAALIHASRILAVELGHSGVRVNSIAPAVVESSMAEMMDGVAREKIHQRGSLPGFTTPSDVADAVAFLISDNAASISAETIRMDRGMPF